MPTHDHDRSGCKALFERLSEYMDGELPLEICAEFDGHFEDCPECVRFLASMRKAVRLVESLAPPELPPDLRREILEAAGGIGEDPAEQ